MSKKIITLSGVLRKFKSLGLPLPAWVQRELQGRNTLSKPFEVPDRFSKLGITGHVAVYLWEHKDSDARVEIEHNKKGEHNFLPFSNDLGRFLFVEIPSKELGYLVVASFPDVPDALKNRWFSYKIDPLGIFEFRTDKSNLSISISYDNRHEFADQMMDYPHDFTAQDRFAKIYELNMMASFDFLTNNWEEFGTNFEHIEKYSRIFSAAPYAALCLPSPISAYHTRAIHLWGTTPILGVDFLNGYFLGTGDASLYPVFKEALRRTIVWVPKSE